MRYLLKNGARKIERILDARAGRFSTAKNRGDNKEADYHMSMLRGMSEMGRQLGAHCECYQTKKPRAKDMIYRCVCGETRAEMVKRAKKVKPYRRTIRGLGLCARPRKRRRS